MRQVWDVLAGGAPPIEKPQQKQEDYDLIIVAGPVWAARPSTPIRSLARRLKSASPNPTGQKFALFLTCGGDSKKYLGEKALDETVNEMPTVSIATALLKSADIEGEDLLKIIAEFANQIQLSLDQS